MLKSIKKWLRFFRAERKRRLWLIAIETAVFIILVFLTTILLRPLQHAMGVQMANLRNELFSVAENRLNRKISYSSMGPSIFGTLDVRNLRIFDPSGTAPSPVLRIARLRLSYSFIDLLRGKGIEAMEGIRIDRPVLVLDTRWDADLLDLIRSLSREGEAGRRWRGIDFLPENLVFRIRGGDATVLAENGRFQVEGLSADAFLREERILFQGRWTSRLALEDPLFQPFTVYLPARFTGSFSSDLTSGSMNIDLPSLSGDTFHLHPLTVRLALDEEKLSARRISEDPSFDISMDYFFESRRLSAGLKAENFSPAQMFTFAGSMKEYNLWLGSRFRGSVSLQREQEGSLGYDFDLSGSLPGGLPIGNASFSLTGSGDEDFVRFQDCTLHFPQGSLRFAGGTGLRPFAPSGRITIEDLSHTGDGLVNGTVSVSTEGREISFFADNLSLGPVLISALDGGIIRNSRGISFSLSALRFKNIESYEDVRLSLLSLEGSYDNAGRHLQAGVRLDAFSAADMAAMVRPFAAISGMVPAVEDFLSRVSVTTDFSLNTDLTHISYTAPQIVIAYTGKTESLAVLSLTGTDSRFDLEESHILWSEGRTDISGYTDFSDLENIAFSFHASHQDLAYDVEGVVLDRGRYISLHGSHGLGAYIGITDVGGYSGYLELRSLPIPYKGQLAHLSMFASLRYDSPAFWYVDLDHLEVSGFRTPASSNARIFTRGWVDQEGAQFPELVYDDGRGALSGEYSLSWEKDFSGVSLLASLANRQERESWDIAGSFRDGWLDVRLYGQRMQLSRFFSRSSSALFSGDLWLRWASMNDYSVQMNARSLTARLGDREVQVSASASLDTGALVVENMRINWGAIQGEIPRLQVDRRLARVLAEARFQGSHSGQDMALSANLSASLTPADSWLDVQRLFSGFNGSLSIPFMKMDNLESAEPFYFAFARTAAGITFSGGPNNMIQAGLSSSGEFYANFAKPFPVRTAIAGIIKDQTIEAQAPNVYIDLPALWQFLPIKRYVNFTGGFAFGSLRITGPLLDPEFYGEARGSSIRIEVPQYLAAEIGPTPALLVLDGNEMSFGPLDVAVGSGMGQARGWFRFEQWNPDTFGIDINVPYDRPVPCAFDIMGILAQGNASGNLFVSRADDMMRVTGDVTAHDTEIALDIQELLAAQVDAGYAMGSVPVSADVTVRTGRRVEFVWPRREFPLLSAYIDVGTGLRITKDYSGEHFSVIGDVNLRSGEIFYFQRSFYLREGQLSFNENEVQFDPRLTARAEIRDRTDNGPVTISMVVDNAPLLNFTARLESNPPLSQFDILSLLGQSLAGSPSSEEDGGVRYAFVSSTADIMAQFSMVRMLERQVRNFLRLDMFSIRTQVLQNALLQASGVTEEPVDRNVRVGNYFDNTTVFLGKYIGSDMFVQGMLSMRYNEYKPNLGGLTFEPDFGIELRSPVVTIRWDLVPVHLENMFVDDMSFTLSWRWWF